MEILREDLSSKKFVTINKYNNVVIKDYIPRKDITNENPVVTQEKEKERALHHTVISSIIHKFSLNNYYRLNLLLKDLTFNQLYYQPFIDKKGLEKQKIEEKREFLFLNVKENISIKEQLHIFKKIFILNELNFLHKTQLKTNLIFLFDFFLISSSFVLFLF